MAIFSGRSKPEGRSRLVKLYVLYRRASIKKPDINIKVYLSDEKKKDKNIAAGWHILDY
ncbi:hypothetical protein [Marispirochaeta aestuarii]|uniref:hypothetical protein n=1 Tax=Marispirochaeta aestuarii TaxID=1963862 RepID=UPI001301AC2F|nr:hypothetical protein [Marispirochaeta aestuarii]